jgi:peptidyl-prolyl cis-trans isomerase SurA
MRKNLFRTVFFLLLYGIWGPISVNEAVVDRIVAIVNQEIITLSEVEKWSDSLQKEVHAENRFERRERIQEIYRKALEQLIEEKLVDLEVKRYGIKVTSKEVEGALEEVRQKNAASHEDFEKVLAKEGLTLEAFKKQIEKRIQRIKLFHWAVKGDPNAGEKELRDFYQNHIDRYRSNELYRASHILFLVPKDASSEEVQGIRRRCQKVLEKIKGGEDFGEMALLYSQDISAKDRGNLGYFKKGELFPAFEKEALRLKVGEVSGIVRSEFGFHIIKLLDRRGEIPLPFEQVIEKVKADYYERETERALKQFISTLKEKSVIEIKL